MYAVLFDVSECYYRMVVYCVDMFFFQAEDGIRDLVRSRGLGDVYKRQLERGRALLQEDAGERLDLRDALAERWHEDGEPGLSLIHI